MPELHYPGKILLCFRQSSLGAASNDLVGNVLGNRLVVRRLHDILATALGLGTQVGGVAEHLSQRNESVDTLSACHCLHALDLATARVQVADDIAQILIRNDNTTFMMGSVMMGSALRIASLKAIEPAMEKAISEESTS